MKWSKYIFWNAIEKKYIEILLKNWNKNEIKIFEFECDLKKKYLEMLLKIYCFFKILLMLTSVLGFDNKSLTIST